MCMTEIYIPGDNCAAPSAASDLITPPPTLPPHPSPPNRTPGSVSAPARLEGDLGRAEDDDRPSGEQDLRALPLPRALNGDTGSGDFRWQEQNLAGAGFGRK